MSYPLDERLRALARSAPRAGIFSDFDGCLAPIVADPAAARPLPGAIELLEQLARSFAIVAVVSGRPVSFLAAHLQAAGVRLVGLYGLEEWSDRGLWIAPEAEAARGAVRRAHERLTRAAAGRPGIWIEDKILSVAVHVRRAPDPADALRWSESLVAEIAASEGLGVQRGRLVREVRPRGGDKGDAVARLARETGVSDALIAGDDAGDIAAFDALEHLNAIRVAVASPEAPPVLLDKADATVEGPPGYLDLLRRLVAATDL